MQAIRDKYIFVMNRDTLARCPGTRQRYIVYQRSWAFWYKIEDHDWSEVQNERRRTEFLFWA